MWHLLTRLLFQNSFRKFSCPGRESNLRPGFILPTSWWLDALKNNWEIIQRNVFLNERKRNPGVWSADRGFRTTVPSRTSITPVKQKVIVLHARSTLASVSSGQKEKNKKKRNNFAHAAHFFVHFFCHCFMEEMFYVFLYTFLMSLILTLVAVSISHFLSAAIKYFHVFLPMMLLSVVSLFFTLALSLFSTLINVDIWI